MARGQGNLGARLDIRSKAEAYWENMQVDEGSPHTFKVAKKGVTLLYRYRGEENKAGSRSSHASSTVKESVCETENEIRECARPY